MNFENYPRVASTCARIFAAVGLMAPLLVDRVVAARPLPASASATISVFATGLNNPRGLKFGPDGSLYVAEGGTGGSDSTVRQCEQVVPPVGPYTGSLIGGRMSKIDANGVRTTVVDMLPSSQTSPNLGSLVSGVADVAFISDTLYALLAGAGCSHGVPDVPNGVIRVNSDGTWTLIANLSAFQQANPVQNPVPNDFEPDGTWYSMIAVRGNLYAVEPNHGELDKITPEGHVSRVIDISASQGHIVPTSVAYHGNFYVGNLNTFPIEEGSAKIYKITPSGRIKIVAEGSPPCLGWLLTPGDACMRWKTPPATPFLCRGLAELCE